jgi:F0F1-type ATP synthase assembly protein I
MAIIIALGVFIGKWIDGRLAMAKPIFTIILCLLAIGGSIYMVYRDVSQPKK